MPPPPRAWNPLEGPRDYTTTSTVRNDTHDAIDPTKAAFSGKIVFINGASRGLGRQMALSFAQAGASQIVVSARSDLTQVVEDIVAAARDARRPRPDVLRRGVSVAEPDSVKAAVGEIEADFGKLDVLINVAAAMGQKAGIGNGNEEDWWNTTRLPLLLKSERKTIINISSVGGLLTTAGLSAYQTSKTAVTRLTDFLATEYAAQGLIAFCVHPGNILTNMLGDLDEQWKGIFTESPRPCGDTLVYLASERRQWMSGRYVNCTWDMPESTPEAKRKEIEEGDLLKLTLKTL